MPNNPTKIIKGENCGVDFTVPTKSTAYNYELDGKLIENNGSWLYTDSYDSYALYTLKLGNPIKHDAVVFGEPDDLSIHDPIRGIIINCIAKNEFGLKDARSIIEETIAPDYQRINYSRNILSNFSIYSKWGMDEVLQHTLSEDNDGYKSNEKHNYLLASDKFYEITELGFLPHEEIESQAQQILDNLIFN